LRLTHIKLAGFKSFVDPTSIPVPGQLVGVVGPNGCGKSNVIDAVRWVLGESSARQLRGESMQDVIFNGSSTRKPVGRASVELVFDNSLGRASGQWTQYAEISVKRVLERNGDSSYYINNLHVRRRDITDIFLGTGLGARAYAIIEQGMISRIIEARPEEMRVFLEEAAGISKYKERRKETGARLNDTRENLQRVDDIRQELEKQLQHLEVQAKVAARYRELQERLHTVQNLLWLLKQQEAAAQRVRFEKEIQRQITDLEALTARLRDSEKRLEEVRAEHYSASDALHAAQGELYAANAEVAKLEQQLQHLRESRERYTQQLAAQKNQFEQQARNLQATEENLRNTRNELKAVQVRVALSREAANKERQQLPAAEEAYRGAQQRVAEGQRELSLSEQAWQIEEAHRNHAIKAIGQLQARTQRLREEQAALPETDDTELNRLEEELALVAEQLAEFQASLVVAQDRLPATEQAKRQADQVLQQATQAITRVEAQLNALQQIQKRLEQNQQLSSWLARHQLENLPRLWQSIQIEAGWEQAVESVLRERVNAVALADVSQARAWQSDVPPSHFVAVDSMGAASGETVQSLAGAEPLLRKVSLKGSGVASAVLEEWLGHVYAVESIEAAWSLQQQLGPGMMVITREGHALTRHSVSFHAPESELHGVLARQREIEELQVEVDLKRDELPLLKEAQAAAETALEECRSDGARLRSQISETQQRHHRLQMEVLKLSQVKERVQQRAEQLARELEEIEAEIAVEAEQKETGEYKLKEYRAQIEALRERLDDLREVQREADGLLMDQRNAVSAADREVQEAEFAERTCITRIGDLENAVKVLAESQETLQLRLEELEIELEELDEEPIRHSLQEGLSQRQEKEQALSAARDHLAGVANFLAEIERERIASEQQQHPMRERINELRLKEQEARLSEEQFVEQLQGADANIEELSAQLEPNAKVSTFQSEISRLNNSITELGAVNLAALDELTAGQERKTYLDSQAADLNEAIETLENAIRRIDLETRERLQETFDVVNRHIGEMFPTLFGGGQAKLVLTGEEILDSGIQVIAQPPGKKNSSIQLLSGGEKALTALSLVFSLFQLNPAPFCLLDEVDAPLDDSNTVRFCELVKKMSQNTQFLYISHNKITMEMASQLVGITMQEQGVSRVVAVDMEEAIRLADEAA
jgi:chromosome segregation protein